MSEYYKYELRIALPQGGEVVFSHGLDAFKRLISHNLDLQEGWYAEGWTEPPDYLPAELTTPPMDPQYDLLYDLDAGITGIWYGRDGLPLPVFNHLGQPIGMEKAA